MGMQSYKITAEKEIRYYTRNTEEGGSSSQHALQLINIHNHDFSQC
jgi:hypothetical protein